MAAAHTDRVGSGGGARPRNQPPGHETEPGGSTKMPLTKGKSYFNPSTLLGIKNSIEFLRASCFES